MAGGMAIALAGPSFGIKYTSDVLDPGNPAQQFVYGVLDNGTGTCASMSVLYLGIAHRLGWSLKAVVIGDHMWTGWDAGRPVGCGSTSRATASASDGTTAPRR
jgi:hypothetical protein